MAYHDQPPRPPPPGPALSRLQLAAALIEYDNDQDDPDAGPYRSHRDSAMFLPFLPGPPGPPRLDRPVTHRSNLRLSGSAYDEARSARVRDSATMEILEGRSRVSEDQAHYQKDLAEAEVEVEVDVSRWDLPEHLVSTSAPINPDPIPVPSRPPPRSAADTEPATRPFPVARPSSSYSVPRLSARVDDVADVDQYGITDALNSVERVKQLVDARQGTEPIEGERERIRTLSGGDLGLRDRNCDRRTARVSFSDMDVHDRPSTSMGIMPTSPRSAMSRLSRTSLNPAPTPNPIMIPLPTSPARSRQSSYLPSISGIADVDDNDGLEIMPPDEEPNPFAMPAPPPELGSRFDPKQLESQRSRSSMSRPLPDGLSGSHLQERSSIIYDDRYSTTGPSHRHMLNLTPEERDVTEHLVDVGVGGSHRQSHLYSTSNQEPPPRVFAEIPSFEEYGKPLMPARYSTNRPKRLSRHELLRPKTLVMPHSLADLPPPASPPKKKWEIAPDGFEIGPEKPLPAGARTSVLTIGGVARIPLSLSQRTFRSSLMVGNEGRDSAFLGGAEEDGEVGVTKKELVVDALDRRPGKLYGKSLMDQLEARKQAMKGQQRQFTGDNRPAMMARAPAQAGQAGQISPTSPSTARGPGPLLQFDEHGNVHESQSPTKSQTSPNKRDSVSLAPPPQRPVGRLTKSTSVFGVDEIWEKEMAKLRIMQENERAKKEREDELARVKQEAKAAKKNKGKEKRKEKALKAEYEPVGDEPDPDMQQDKLVVDGFSPIKKTADLPPMLTFSPEKPRVKSTPSPLEENRGSEMPDTIVKDRVGSDSEDDVPLSRIRRSTSNCHGMTAIALDHPTDPHPASESSEDEDADIPLSRLRKAKHSSPEKPVLPLHTDFGPSAAAAAARAQDKDELQTTGSLGLKLPAIEKTMADLTQPSISHPTGGEDDDDDVPLLLRQAHIKATSPVATANDDDDDLPLGLRQSMRHSSSMAFSSFQPQPPHPGAYMPNLASASVYSYQPPWPPAYPHPLQHQQQHQPMGYHPSFGHMSMPPQMNMNMTMPPLPNFSMMNLPMMMDGSGQMQVQQHDNIDSWRKGVAPPSVSGESRG